MQHVSESFGMKKKIAQIKKYKHNSPLVIINPLKIHPFCKVHYQTANSEESKKNV